MGGDILLPASTYQLVESKPYKRMQGSSYSSELSVGLRLDEDLRGSLDASKRPHFRKVSPISPHYRPCSTDARFFFTCLA